jgi:hypothetical protein
MPETQSQPGDQNQPTHTAAKVVIPFDIDISQIETKLASLEQRIANVKNVGIVANQEQAINQSLDKHDDAVVEQKTTSTMFDKIDDTVVEQKTTSTMFDKTDDAGNEKQSIALAILDKLASIEQHIVNAQNMGIGQEQSPKQLNEKANEVGTEKQLMMSTMLRISDLMRQINDTVTLIYNTQLNNNA